MAVIDQAIAWCAPAPPVCLGDATGDLLVNFEDLNEALTSWDMSVTPGASGDVDGSGIVDFDDLNLILENWANDCN